MIFGKPVIYADTSFDNSSYDACWLDEDMWTFTTLPKIGRHLKQEDFPDLKNIIGEMLKDPGYHEAIETAKRESGANIGSSARLTTDYILETADALKQVTTK